MRFSIEKEDNMKMHDINNTSRRYTGNKNDRKIE